MANSFTLKIKANLNPLKEKLNRIERLERELDEVMAGLIEAMNDLDNTRVPFCLDRCEEEDTTAGNVTEYEGL